MTVSEDERARVQRNYFPVQGEGAAQRFYFPAGAEEVLFGADAPRDVAALCEKFGYQRPFVFSSRTLNRTTDVVDRIAKSLGMKLVGLSDRVGEHAPVSNVIAAISEVRQAGADVLVCIGGGSVMDFGKFVQLGVTEGVRTREDLRALQVGQQPDLNQRPDLRQITIPTTFSLSEWTPAGTPVDDVTGKKITLRIPNGVGRAIVYDPDVVRHTPLRLALVTAIRGLDHSINTVCSTAPNELCTVLALQAITHFHTAIPLLAQGKADIALPMLQRASWLGGVCQMSVPHGFSHFMVHVLAPWAHIGHSETACVMMLAQARWLREHDDPRLAAVAAAMGRPGETLDVILYDLLRDIGLPTSLREIGVDPEQISGVVPHALAHPYLTLHNLRPITTADDILTALASVAE
ncbi:iron-containing alcohol dehydrogenase [Streptomyces melanosporofaciens]|uniref:Alcohol dehydrogenase, class IV n=1 Tax=Streptomyces melanosporofaciens TaxID=67327 RepID=A0A1H4KM79_STRMJ|nr:iron-containing alcohol dehydrogenase [Streptomyces melanosporofaciens]SEB59346.1 Alcohol dehydrogenase, class IV [Streptomyces melanosporofaciens]